jgi:hypothetical protein
LLPVNRLPSSVALSSGDMPPAPTKKGNAVKAAPQTHAKKYKRTAQSRRSLLRNGLVLLRLFKGLAVQVSGFWGSSSSTPRASVQSIAEFYLVSLPLGSQPPPPLIDGLLPTKYNHGQ